LSKTSDKTDSNQDLQLGELYWGWSPDRIDAIGAIWIPQASSSQGYFRES